MRKDVMTVLQMSELRLNKALNEHWAVCVI